MFDVILVGTGEHVSGPYLTAAEAKEYVAALKQVHEAYGFSPLKTRIKMRVAENWRAREAKRLADGTYQPMPQDWLEAPWWTGSEAEKDHFAHRSKTSPGKIAFTESPEAGTRDLQKVMSPCAYLARFFVDKLQPHEIRDIGQAFGSDGFTLNLSFSPDDFERIFEEQDVQSESSDHLSCMRYNRSEWGLERHPAHVYGAGDLAIAWIEEGGGVLARAVVWPAQKTFLRTYAVEENYHHVLQAILKREGYKRAEGFEGAKLLKVAGVEEHYSVMPYLDGDANRVKVEGDFFVICGEREDDTYSANTTDGEIYLTPQVPCSQCGQIHCRSSMTIVGLQGRLWCQECVNQGELAYCAFYNLVMEGQTEQVCNALYPRLRIRNWSTQAVAEHAFLCNRTNCYYASANFTRREDASGVWCDLPVEEPVRQRRLEPGVTMHLSLSTNEIGRLYRDAYTSIGEDIEL